MGLESICVVSLKRNKHTVPQKARSIDTPPFHTRSQNNKKRMTARQPKMGKKWKPGMHTLKKKRNKSEPSLLFSNFRTYMKLVK